MPATRREEPTINAKHAVWTHSPTTLTPTSHAARHQHGARKPAPLGQPHAPSSKASKVVHLAPLLVGKGCTKMWNMFFQHLQEQTTSTYVPTFAGAPGAPAARPGWSAGAAVRSSSPLAEPGSSATVTIPSDTLRVRSRYCAGVVSSLGLEPSGARARAHAAFPRTYVPPA